LQRCRIFAGDTSIQTSVGGDNVIWGGDGNDTIFSTFDNDDSNDTFGFIAGFGDDQIQGFDAENGSSAIDVIDFSAFTDLDGELSAYTAVGGEDGLTIVDGTGGNAGNVIITLEGKGSILLYSTTVADLTDANFIFGDE
jgi:hypothetical protein